MASKKKKQPLSSLKQDPKPHCPEHDEKLVVVKRVPGGIVGQCPKGCELRRGQWVAR